MDIESRAVEIYQAVNIFGFPPFNILFETKVEDFLYIVRYSQKQSILVRIDTSGAGGNLSTDSLSSPFPFLVYLLSINIKGDPMKM